MLDLERWTDDRSAPGGREARRDLGLRVGVPAAVWWALVVGLGLLLTGPLAGLRERETAVSEWFVEQRTATLDTLTAVWGAMGTTETIIGICLVVSGVVWWRTRQWWYAVVPAIATPFAVPGVSALPTITGKDGLEMSTIWSPLSETAT